MTISVDYREALFKKYDYMFKSEDHSFNLEPGKDIVSHLVNINTTFMQIRNTSQTKIVISVKAKLEKLCIC